MSAIAPCLPAEAALPPLPQGRQSAAAPARPHYDRKREAKGGKDAAGGTTADDDGDEFDDEEAFLTLDDTLQGAAAGRRGRASLG